MTRKQIRNLSRIYTMEKFHRGTYFATKSPTPKYMSTTIKFESAQNINYFLPTDIILVKTSLLLSPRLETRKL